MICFMFPLKKPILPCAFEVMIFVHGINSEGSVRVHGFDILDWIRPVLLSVLEAY